VLVAGGMGNLRYTSEDTGSLAQIAKANDPVVTKTAELGPYRPMRMTTMEHDHLLEIYSRIKQTRDLELNRLLAILRSKAESDPELREVVAVLERWSQGPKKIR
jgi:hypothetical protein